MTIPRDKNTMLCSLKGENSLLDIPFFKFDDSDSIVFELGGVKKCFSLPCVLEITPTAFQEESSTAVERLVDFDKSSASGDVIVVFRHRVTYKSNELKV